MARPRTEEVAGASGSATSTARACSPPAQAGRRRVRPRRLRTDGRAVPRASRITNIDDANGSVEVEGGSCSPLNETLKERSRSFPIDLGATRSEGWWRPTRVARASSLRRRAREPARAARGAARRLTWAIRGLRKNNTGLDAKRLFSASGAFIVTERSCVHGPSAAGRSACGAERQAVVGLLGLGRLGEFLTATRRCPPRPWALIGTERWAQPVPGSLRLRGAVGCPRPFPPRRSIEAPRRGPGRIHGGGSGHPRRGRGRRHQRPPPDLEPPRRGQVLDPRVSVPRSRMAEFTAEVARRVARSRRTRAWTGHWTSAAPQPGVGRRRRRGAQGKAPAPDLRCVTGFGGSYSAGLRRSSQHRGLSRVRRPGCARCARASASSARPVDMTSGASAPTA